MGVLPADSLAGERAPELLREAAGQPDQRPVRHEVPPIGDRHLRMRNVFDLDQPYPLILEVEQENAIPDLVRMWPAWGEPPVVFVVPVRRLRYDLFGLLLH